MTTSRPILMSKPMVLAILNGSKTQTRRVVKPQPHHVDGGVPFGNAPAWAHAEPGSMMMRCPYGKRGDTLWVREAWRAPLAYELTKPSDIPADTPIVYQADGAGSLPHFNCGKLRPSMFMPRWASRITLEITRVRVERLQDISEADCIAEGCTENHNGYFWGGPHPVSGLKQMATAKHAYQDLWESINGPDSWAVNPWVFVVEFKAVNP